MLAVAGAGVTQDTDVLLEKIDDVEKSHYLGGDVKHTHLVRGLDKALLHKVRSELETSRTESQQAERAKHVRAARACVVTWRGSRTGRSRWCSNGQAEKLEFNSTMASNIHTQLFGRWGFAACGLERVLREC